MKRPSILLSALALALLLPRLAPAHAQEATVTTVVTEPRHRVNQPSVEKPSADRPARFSLGAGLGFNAVGDVYPTAASGLAGLGALAAASSRAPFGTSLFEVATSPKWRIVASVGGSYTRRIADEEAVDQQGGAKSSWTVSGAVGFRCVLNPGSVVEVSPLFTVGAFRSMTEDMVVGSTLPVGATQPVYTLRDAMTLGYDARLGLVLEHALLSNLYLRFETYFLRASYTKSAIRDTPDNGIEKCNCRRDISLAYGLSPVLQLRLTF